MKIAVVAVVLFVAWIALHAKTSRPDGRALPMHPFRRLLLYLLPSRDGDRRNSQPSICMRRDSIDGNPKHKRMFRSIGWKELRFLSVREDGRAMRPHSGDAGAAGRP